jgi:hypothetical protein
MDLAKVADIIDDMFREPLLENVYPFGFPPKGNSNKYATGSLYNSVSTVVKKTGDDFIVDIFVNDYYTYVNRGRARGKGYVPYSALMTWIQARGIKFNFSAEQKMVSFAYAINKKRKKDGKKPLPMKVLLDWMKDKNIQPKFDEMKATVFAIQGGIRKNGIRAARVEDKFYEMLEKDSRITDLIGDLGFEDLVNKISKILIDTKTK